jgi:hypothetical protein
MKCHSKPVFILAGSQEFFDALQAAIHTLDTNWPNHTIVVYDLGLRKTQQNLVGGKHLPCDIIAYACLFSCEKDVIDALSLNFHLY